MTDYWKSFWLSHAKESQRTELQAQVLRTLNRQPVSPDAFAVIVDSIVKMLRPDQGNNLLDLCCGNGVITLELTDIFSSIQAVDLSEEFVARVRAEASNKVTAFAADVRSVEFPEKSFDRILLYAGLQYFSEAETIDLFMRLKHWLRDDGVVLLGDIPDVNRKWEFFNSRERESAYFESLKNGNPIVGNWFAADWLEKLSRHAGFISAIMHRQPNSLPYRHYRFDLVLTS